MPIRIITTFMLATFTFAAHAADMSSSDIKAAISGKKVVLSTSLGTFPLRYRVNRTVSGDGTAAGLAKYFNPKETGKWWVANNRLCQRFPTWYKGRSLCFTLSKISRNKLKWVRQDGYSGTATIRR